MKILISILTLAFSPTVAMKAHAADKKIGNLIAVERSIDNVYQTCVGQFETKTAAESAFYFCKFEAKKSNADVAPSTQRLLTLSNPSCEVEGTLENSIILVTVRIKSPNPNITAARACLQQAINASPNKDSFKFVMYTVE